MTLPFSVPDWLPWWVPVAVLVPVLLYLLVFLMMPVSVLGMKGRLDGLEARLDDIHEEIRMLALRLPDHAGGSERGYVQPERPPVLAPRQRMARPPVLDEPDDQEEEPPPPEPHEPPRRRFPIRGADRGEARIERSEPRLGWPPA
jgi:hypothetical protein